MSLKNFLYTFQARSTYLKRSPEPGLSNARWIECLRCVKHKLTLTKAQRMSNFVLSSHIWSLMARSVYDFLHVETSEMTCKCYINMWIGSFRVISHPTLLSIVKMMKLLMKSFQKRKENLIFLCAKKGPAERIWDGGVIEKYPASQEIFVILGAFSMIFHQKI